MKTLFSATSPAVAPVSQPIVPQRSLRTYLHPAAIPPALRGWVIPGLMLLTWWVAYTFHLTESALFVPMEKVLETAIRLSATGELWDALGSSLYRMLVGFSLGATGGLIVGTTLGLSRWMDTLISPTFNAVKQVSLLAWIPLISLWFGLGDMAKIVFLALAAFFPVVINTFEGIRSVPRELMEVAHVFAYSRWQWFSRVVWPSALPSIFAGIYLALIYSWLATLGGEYLLTSGKGIGNLLTDGREHFWMDYVLLGIIIVGAVGTLLNWIAQWIEVRLLGPRSQFEGKANVSR